MSMNVLEVLTALFYAASLGAYLTVLATARRVFVFLATVLLAGGVVVHYFSLVARSHSYDTVPYNDLYG